MLERDPQLTPGESFGVPDEPNFGYVPEDTEETETAPYEFITPDIDIDAQQFDEERTPEVRAYNNFSDQRDLDRLDEEADKLEAENMFPEDVEEDKKQKAQWLLDYQKGLKEKGDPDSQLLSAWIDVLHEQPKDQDGPDYNEFLKSHLAFKDFVDNIPRETAKAALGVADGVYNTFGALMMNLSTYGELDWDESYYFRNKMDPNTDNPLRNFYREVAEWFGPAKWLGVFKKGATLKKQFLASSAATWLSTDASDESLMKMASTHPKFTWLKNQYLSWAIENDDDSYLLKRLKHTIQEEILIPGAALTGLGVTMGVSKGAAKAWKVTPKYADQMAETLHNSFKLFRQKEVFTAKNIVAYAQDQGGSIRLPGIGNPSKRNASQAVEKFRTSREEFIERVGQLPESEGKQEIINTYNRSVQDNRGRNLLADLEDAMGEVQKKIDTANEAASDAEAFIDIKDPVVVDFLRKYQRMIGAESELRASIAKNYPGNYDDIIDDSWKESVDEVLGRLQTYSRKPVFERPGPSGMGTGTQLPDPMGVDFQNLDDDFNKFVRDVEDIPDERFPEKDTRKLAAKKKYIELRDFHKDMQERFTPEMIDMGGEFTPKSRQNFIKMLQNESKPVEQALIEYAIPTKDEVFQRIIHMETKTGNLLKNDPDFLEALRQGFLGDKDMVIKFAEDGEEMARLIDAFMWIKRKNPHKKSMVDFFGDAQFKATMDAVGNLSYENLLKFDGELSLRTGRKQQFFYELADHNMIEVSGRRLQAKRRNTADKRATKEYKKDSDTDTWDDTQETIEEILQSKTKSGKHLIDTEDVDLLSEEIQEVYSRLKAKLVKKYKRNLPEKVSELDPSLENMYLLDDLVDELQKTKKKIILKHLQDTVFSKRKDGEGILQDFATVTDDGVIIDIRNYANLDDYWKAVKKLAKDNKAIQQLESEYDRKLAVQKRGATPIADDLLNMLDMVTPFDKETLLERFTNRPLGQALNDAEIAVGIRIIERSYSDIASRIDALKSKMAKIDKTLADADPIELQAIQEDINVLMYEIIPSFVAGGASENARGLRQWRISGSKDLSVFTKHIADEVEALGGADEIALKIDTFGQMVKEGPDMLKRAGQVASGLKGHWLTRIKNAMFMLRANDLIGTTRSLDYNALANLGMISFKNLSMHMDVALTLIKGQHGQVHKPHIQDIMALWGSVIPAAFKAGWMGVRHAWKIVNPFSDPGTLLQGRVNQRLQARDAQFFNTADPNKMAAKEAAYWSRFKDKPVDTIGDSLATVFEKMVHYSTWGLVGMKSQTALDDIARTLIGTQVRAVLASRKARADLAQYPTRNFWQRFSRYYDNPTDEMLRQQAEFGDYVTQTMPINSETSPFNAWLLDNILRNKNILGGIVGDVGKVIVPFATPILNMSKTLATSNLIGGPINRMLDERAGKKFTEAQKQSQLADQLVGTATLGYFLYKNRSNQFITGSAPSDQEERKMLEAIGVEFDSILFEDPDTSAVRYYKIDRVDPYGRMMNLIGDMDKSFQQLDDDEYAEALNTVTRALLTNLTSGLIYDYVSMINEFVHWYDSDKRERRSRQWMQEFMAKILVDFVPHKGLMAEQRKTDHPYKVLVNSGNKVVDENKWNKFFKGFEDNEDGYKEAAQFMDQFEANITLAESIVKQFNSVAIGRTDLATAKRNMFGKRVLIPNEFKDDPGFSFNIPTAVSMWLKTNDYLKLNIDSVGFNWRTPDSTRGFDIRKADEIGQFILSSDGIELDLIASDIAASLYEQYGEPWVDPSGPNKTGETEKEIRIFLEIYGLSQADKMMAKMSQVGGEDRPSTIKLWEASPNFRISPTVTDEEKIVGNTISLGPQYMGEFLQTMNEVTVEDDPKGTKFRDALYDVIMMGYPNLGDKQGTLNHHPKLKFRELTSVYRQYRELGEARFRENNQDLFRTYQNWQKKSSEEEEIEVSEQI